MRVSQADKAKQFRSLHEAPAPLSLRMYGMAARRE